MTTANVVGAGPNGLAAAIVLAQAGVRVTVLEAEATPGGGSRTKELTLPGFRHDVCSAIHPLAAGSPFFNSLPLEAHGLRWINPDVAMAHPFDDRTAVTLRRSLDQTASLLGRDAAAYRGLMRPLVENWDKLAGDALAPLLRVPRHPLLLAQFGLSAMRPATSLAGSFQEPRTRALLAGLAAHANVPLTKRFTASFALVLAGAAHAVGWPLAAGGSQSIADALASYLCSLGGEVVTNHRVSNLSDVAGGDAVLFDLTPRQVLRVAGDRLDGRYRKDLGRYRYGPGVFKIDYALDAPIPWMAPECRDAATVHLGGSMQEIVAGEALIASGGHPEKPYVIVAQPSLFDPTRAPEGKHTGWAYCHVPNGSDEDMTGRIEAQIERFAPGFRDRILARHTLSASDLEAYNENYVGGDIAGGSHEGLQLFLRPAPRLSPYTTPDSRLFVCSSSTPPGAGVHGLCGYFAAQATLKRLGKR
ncbi:MAG: FAD-dependent oxidoreductase [Dehalococcoidia bacterium]|nr:FAD-dependent oxidoreductase [Dehalococcoidia bacterium]